MRTQLVKCAYNTYSCGNHRNNLIL